MKEYKKLWESSTSTAIIAKTVSTEKDHDDKMNDLQRQFKNQLKYIKQKYNAEIRKITQ